MIQLSGRRAGFTGPRINGSPARLAGLQRPRPPQLWMAALRAASRDPQQTLQPFPSPKRRKRIVSPPPAITGVEEKNKTLRWIDVVIDGGVAMETGRLSLIGYFWLWETD